MQFIGIHPPRPDGYDVKTVYRINHLPLESIEYYLLFYNELNFMVEYDLALVNILNDVIQKDRIMTIKFFFDELIVYNIVFIRWMFVEYNKIQFLTYGLFRLKCLYVKALSKKEKRKSIKHHVFNE